MRRGPKRRHSSWEGFLEVRDLAVHTVAWGPWPPAGRAEGRRIVLLHGLAGDSLHWELTGGLFARHLGAMVIAPDLAGFGLTRTEAEGATLQANAQLVVSLLDRYGPAMLVGSSMGGAIAVAVAAARPELVNRLVLIGSVLPQPPWPQMPRAELPHNWAAAIPGYGPVLVAAYRDAHSDQAIVDDRFRRSFFDLTRVDPDLRDRMVALVRRRREFQEAPYTYSAAARSLFWYAGGAAGMVRDMLEVECPSALIHGAEDRLVPLALAQAALKRRPDWELVVLESCGHMPHLEAPDRLVAVLAEWIDSRSRTSSTRVAG